MALDPSLPKDAGTARHILDTLVIKDQDETICRYPTCPKSRKAPENGGKPPAYCENTLHTPQRNLRARLYLEDLAKELPPTFLETEQPVTAAQVQSLREKTLAELQRFSGQLSQYVAGLKELADPEITVAQIEAAQHRADALIAVSQEKVETERSLRLAAEHARDTAQRDAQAARDEAALAIAKMQEIETHVTQQQQAYALQIVTLQQEHEQIIETIRAEAQQRIEEIQRQADQAIARAQDATTTAEEEVQHARMRAHDAETETRMQIEHANHLVAEAQATLRREQEEVLRLRQERDDVVADARTRAETDRKEIQQIREALTRENLDAHTRADDDRTEIQRLRESLKVATMRADDLARANDGLRTQLLQETRREKEKPE